MERFASGEEALDEKVALMLRPVSLLMFAVYAAFGVGHSFLVPEPAQGPLMGIALSTSAVGLGLHLTLRRWSLPARWAHPVQAALCVLMAGNAVLHVVLTGDPAESVNLALLIMAFGAVLLRRGWLAGAVGLGVLVGLLAVHATPAEVDWARIGFAFGSASVVAGLVCELRRRAELDLAAHRAEEARIRRELEALVADQTADLRDANRVLQQQVQARNRADELRRGLASAMDQAGEAIVVMDRKGLVRYANPAFARMLERPLDELVGADVLGMARNGTDQSLMREIAIELGAGRPWQGRYETVGDGNRRFVRHASISPVRNDEDRVVGFIGVTRDLTREASLEAELLQAKKMEAVGRLAGGIAHDFNNWLTVIRGYCDLLEEPRDEETLGEASRMITQATDNAIALTRQLLAFSRKQVVRQRALDPNQAVRALEPMLRRLIPESIELVVDLSEEAGAVWADPAQIDQVVTNLVVNARDAMPEGGRLTVSCTRVAPEEFDAESGIELGRDHWRLAVRDSGVGMDDETREQIFDPFFTTKDTGHGTGLGLSTVYGIVRQCGGDVRVESRPGEGTTVEVYLPWREGGVPADAGLVELPAQAAGPNTLLLVEDEPRLRRLIRRMLEEGGHRVLEAGDGAEALESLVKHASEVDAVLTDVVMPVLGGLALGREIEARWPGLPVVYMTGYPKGEAGGPQEIPADAVVLHKPFTRPDLVHVLGQLAASRRD